mmetsp:Transcript_18202/g.33001  ORF Transcript_18202/g.33001 Transcript_18202/m.33001 type:complete len:111 (+) Transcript_18202:81-413(+)
MVAPARRVSFGSAEVVYFTADEVDTRLPLMGFEDQLGQQSRESCCPSGNVEGSLSEEDEREEMEALMQTLSKADQRRSQRCVSGFSMGLEISLNTTTAQSRISQRRASLE